MQQRQINAIVDFFTSYDNDNNAPIVILVKTRFL